MCDVAGDGACLVNPLDVAAIREGVLRMIADPGYRDGLVQRGFVNAARYSPSAICVRLLDVYSRQAS